MTDAVCFKCGNRKHGAWVSCPTCSFPPGNEDEAAVSLALTDHYQDEASLGMYALQIMSGKPLQLSPEAKAQLLTQMRSDPAFQSLLAALERKAHSTSVQAPERQAPSKQVSENQTTAKVLTYSNSALTCYSTIQLESGEKVFISIASMPRPSVVIYKSRLLGLANSAIWEFTPEMAGGYDAYVRKLMRAFADPREDPKHPLDAIKDVIMGCASISEVMNTLFAAERRMNTPLPDEA